MERAEALAMVRRLAVDVHEPTAGTWDGEARVSAPAILPGKRDRWLAARRQHVTASDVAAILGEDPRRGPLAIYLSKVSDIEPEDTLPMRRGRRFEAAIGEEYAEQTGRMVFAVPEYELLPHPSIPWLAATLDRKTVGSLGLPDPFGGISPHGPPFTTGDVKPGTLIGERAPLQIKMALGSASDWKDEPPLAYAVQVTIEMACAEATWGALCGMVGPGPLKTFDLPRNDAFLEAALPKLEEFWLRVQRREPPEADGLPGTTEAIKALWADEDGETIPLDADALQLADDLEMARARVAAASATVEELQNKLRARMGSASFGALTDGSFLTLKTTRRKGYVVEPTEYRALRRWWPRIRRR